MPAARRLGRLRPAGRARGALGARGLARRRRGARSCAGARDAATSTSSSTGDPAEAARAIARAGGRAACFALSEEFGSWRVVGARLAPGRSTWSRCAAGSLEADLALRDFTVNAIAEPLAGGEPIDPLGGLADLAARRLRMAGPGAFADDPLRVLRLVRVAVELGCEPEPETLRAAARARRRARALSRRSGCSSSCGGSSPRARRCAGLEMLSELRATERRAARSSRRCAGSSRTASTTPTSTGTRSRCSRTIVLATARRCAIGRRARRSTAAGRSQAALGEVAARSVARCWPSRSPTSSRAGRRCAGARCCTTPPSR